MHAFSLVSVLAAVSYVLANPLQREIKVVVRDTSEELDLLSTGNKAFRDNIAATDPGLLQKLADEGQCMRLPPSKVVSRILI
jgi:carbonic anhydrase